MYTRLVRNSIFTLILVASFIFATASHAATLERNLTPGDKGPDVSLLQKELKELGFFVYPAITTYYGSVTEKSVQAFQRTNKIVSSGKPSTTGYGRVGPKTRALLNKLMASTDAPSVDTAPSKGIPSIPDGLVASGKNQHITLSWKPVSGAVAYVVKRFNPVTNTYVLIVSGITGTSYTDTTAFAGITYTYIVSAINMAGEGAASNSASATILLSGGTVSPSTPVDTTAPTVTITVPSGTTATVAGSAVTLTATASDAGGIAGVTFKIDGTTIGTEITSSPYTFVWNSSSVSSGAHTLTAVARDMANNTTVSSPVALTVDNNGPVVSSVSSGSPTTSSATITWITDKNSDSQVEYGTSTSYGSMSTLNPAKVTSHSVGLSGLASNTIYHYRVRSADALGNTTLSADNIFLTTAVMPSGAIGMWYIDQYTTASGRPGIPNAVNGTAPTTNLFTASRNLFSNVGAWRPTGATAVDRAATGPDGTTSASTITAAGNWYLYINGPAGDIMPAGTYTIAVNAKRNTGSDQQFVFYKDNTATSSPIKTATDSWQRFSWTFTLATPAAINRIGIKSFNGSAGVDLQIVDLELYAGSSDLGPQATAGQLYVGSSAYDVRPVYSSGTLDLSNGAYGFIQFPTTQSLTNMTMQALVSKVGTASGYDTVLSKVQNYGELDFVSMQNKRPFSSYGGANPVGPNQSTGLWNASGKGYHVVTIRYTGSSFDYWIDDILILHNVTTVTTPVTVNDMFVNLTNTTSLYGAHKYAGAIAMWNRDLSDSEVREAVAVQQARATSSSVSATSANRVLVTEGDSLTGGFSYSYPYLFGPNASPALYGVNYAVSGSSIAGLVGRAAAVDGILPPVANRAGRTFILSVLIGTNDLRTVDPASYLSDLGAYLDARKAAGWKIVLGTVPPATYAPFNVNRNIANPVLRSWLGTRADAIADFAADPIMGPDAAASDTSLYADGQHPTAAGQAYLEAIYRTAVNSI